MSFDSNLVPQMTMSTRPSSFRVGFESFLKEQMVLNDPNGPLLALVKSFVMKSPQPRSMYEFMLSVEDMVDDDVQKMSK